MQTPEKFTDLQGYLEDVDKEIIIGAEAFLDGLITRRRHERLQELTARFEELLHATETRTLVAMKTQFVDLIAMHLRFRNAKESPLLRLSPELRTRIIGLAVVDARGNKISLKKLAKPPLLQTCHQLRAESKKIFFGQNWFRLTCSLHRLFKTGAKASSSTSAADGPGIHRLLGLWPDERKLLKMLFYDYCHEPQSTPRAVPDKRLAGRIEDQLGLARSVVWVEVPEAENKQGMWVNVVGEEQKLDWSEMLIVNDPFEYMDL